MTEKRFISMMNCSIHCSPTTGESLTLDVVDATGTHHKYKLQPKLDEKQGRYLIGFSPEVKTGLFAESVDGYAKMGIAETARYSCSL